MLAVPQHAPTSTVVGVTIRKVARRRGRQHWGGGHLHRRRPAPVDCAPNHWIRASANVFLGSTMAASESDCPRGNREGLGVIVWARLVRVQTEHGPEHRDAEWAVGLHEVRVGCECLLEGHRHTNIGNPVRASCSTVLAVVVLVLRFCYGSLCSVVR